MKLTTEKGPLDLPQGYGITMRRTNPFLSDEGDASIPATLPSSTRNLANLGHPERFDSDLIPNNKISAILEIGPVQKHGKLVIDTAHRHDGIDASFAIDNSEFYVTAKNRSLKEILSSYSVEFESIREACLHMEDVYKGLHPDEDYVIFPVAVSPYEEKDVKTYQYNNEIVIENGNHALQYGIRNVHEGGDTVEVQEGYGVAPFLKLSRLVEILFETLGYTIKENCLTGWRFERMAVVHNCSDCLIQSTLHYKDLVPSMTLSEFLTWLLAKFHVQPVVDSESKEVRIMSMESLLSDGADKDLSDLADGGFTVQLNPSSRVVLVPTNTIEGTEPAAETFDKLIEKYRGYYEINESEYASLYTNYPDFHGCLVMRKATGEFYALEADRPMFVQSFIKRLGSNHFPYDRGNSENKEEFSQQDSMPLMVEGAYDKGFVPYIGERKHAHSTYNGGNTDLDQDLIVVQAVTDNRLCYLTTGTTQPYIPLPNGNDFVNLGFGTTPHALYQNCWKRYNEVLLNRASHLTGRMKFSIADFLGLDVAKTKVANGQKLLTVSMEGSLGGRFSLVESEYILLKNYPDAIADTPIMPSDHLLDWEVDHDVIEVGAALGQEVVDNWTPQNPAELSIEYLGVKHYEILGNNPYPGLPEYEGQVVTVQRQAVFELWFKKHYIPSYDPSGNGVQYAQTMEGTHTVTYTYTAVPI